MSGKIVELQGLRCIAIISVLLFHVWPNFFVNGFLGVDIFFVISGYFMALILLSLTKIKSFKNYIFSFYFRRIYRILPLYLLNIFVTLILIPRYSITLKMPEFLDQIKAALSFTTNFSMFLENTNYFDMHLSLKWFKHYWSLCVEMQFYAIIPLLAFLCRKLPTSINLFLIWPCIIAASQGLSLYALSNFGQKGANFTFSMLPTRIWQFSGGFCAFYALKFFDSFENCNIILLLLKLLRHSITANFISILLLSISLCPILLNQAYAQIVTIILTSILIAAIGRKKEKEELQYSILGNQFIVFIGDASYSLYISHWILVTWFYAVYEHSDENKRFLLCLCFVFGIFIHQWIEKPICQAKIKPWKFFSTLFFVYLGITACIFTMKSSTPSPTSSFVKEIFHNKSHLIANQTQWTQLSASLNPRTASELAMYATENGCHYFPQSDFAESFNTANWKGIVGTELKGTGNLSILVIGNSHAECFFPVAKHVLDGMYSNLNLFLTGGATPFEGFRYTMPGHHLENAVLHYQPDIIFFVFKYQIDMEVSPSEPIEADFGTIKMQEMINFLSNHSKVLLISGIHFEARGFNSAIFAEAMHFNGWIGNYQLPQSDIESQHISSIRRMKEIKCKNCIFMDFLQAYCNDQWCNPIDFTGKVPLLLDDNHLSLFGTYLFTPYLKEYIEKMNEILKFLSFY